MRYYLKALLVLVFAVASFFTFGYLYGGDGWQIRVILSIVLFAVVEVLATLYEIRDVLLEIFEE